MEFSADVRPAHEDLSSSAYSDAEGFAPTKRAPSARAQFVERRTYLRPLNEEGTIFETPKQALDRVMGHQRWLWENTLNRPLNVAEEAELTELRTLIEDCKVSVSGRVKWMGGTDLVKERASGAFNCSNTNIQTPADMVDAFWLLLQGCGVGFKPVPGLMTGFPSTIKNIEIVPSTRTDKGGAEETTSIVDREKSTWTIKFADSAKGWAKAVGSLLGDKPRVETLILDFSELRPGGKRLKGYGWLSSGWEPLMKSMKGIARIMQRRAEQFLTAIDIGDIVNWYGTVLSSRRAAEIWIQEVSDTKLDVILAKHGDFINAKTNRWDYKFEDGTVWSPPADFNFSDKNATEKLDMLAEAAGAFNNKQREQSNNSLAFWNKPDRNVIVDLLHRILDTGEPGFVNAEHARRRAPEWEGFNPCAEILLPSKGFCNLMQTVWHRFNGDFKGLLRAQWIAARANYRQTCVSMRDGVLQLQWNDNQKLLRLCGVSPTGYVAWEHVNDPARLEEAAKAARDGAYAMADDLGLQRPRRVTQVQPAGTVSKALGLEGDEVHEGAHLAMSRWIFNNINFSVFDPMVEMLRAAGYRVRENPVDPTGVLVTFPIEYPESPMFTRIETDQGTMEINQESAISQLERYRLLMNHYVDHNCSITVSFDAHEIEAMADWFMAHWDEYVGVSFLKRNNPLATAEDLGFKYLPQQCVTKEEYEAYAATLKSIDLSGDISDQLLALDDCSTGACPVR